MTSNEHDQCPISSIARALGQLPGINIFLDMPEYTRSALIMRGLWRTFSWRRGGGSPWMPRGAETIRSRSDPGRAASVSACRIWGLETTCATVQYRSPAYPDPRCPVPVPRTHNGSKLTLRGTEGESDGRIIRSCLLRHGNQRASHCMVS